jgi:histidinol-phosphate aminotransferase
VSVRPRDDVALMDGYHSPQVTVDVRLNTNESPFPPPEDWQDRLARAVGEIRWNRYPDREATELRSRIGQLHGVGPEVVFAANGSNEVLQSLLLAYGGAGRTAVMWEPTYALHSHIARVVGTRVVTGERTDDFSLDLGEVERLFATEKPSVAFLCSPNNPTGVTDGEDDVREVLAHAQANDCLLVVDEAYGEFSSWSATGLVSDDVPLVVTHTYSKTWSMAAARLGYLLGPAWVVEALGKVALPYHLDALKQVAGVLALDYVPGMRSRVADLVEERGRVTAALQELPVQVWPSGANFVLFRPLSRPGGEVWARLLDRSVLIRDCSSWPRLEGCLRVTIGARGENDAFLAALRETLA